MKVWEWFKRNWHLLAIALGGIVGGALLQIKLGPKKARDLRMDALSEGSRAARRALEASTGVAVAELEERHEKTLQSLSDAQKAKVDILRDNPDALAKYLVRVGATLPSTN